MLQVRQRVHGVGFAADGTEDPGVTAAARPSINERDVVRTPMGETPALTPVDIGALDRIAGAAPCFQTASSIRRLLPCSVTVNVRSVCRFVHKHVVCLTVLSGLLCGDHSAYPLWARRGLQSRNRHDERAVTDSRGGRVQTVRLSGGVSAGAPVHTDPTPLVLSYLGKAIVK